MGESDPASRPAGAAPGGRTRYAFTIPWRMTGLNEYVAAERSNRIKAAHIKRRETQSVAWLLARAPRFERPVTVRFLWVEPNNRRDHDNVAFAKKFVLDGMVMAGVIPDDSPRWVLGFSDSFAVDRDRPRVEVEIAIEE